MNKELILKLIEKARASADHAYCPYTNVAVGCSLLVDDNIIFGGCNVENSTLSCSAEAAEVAALKAISEGYTAFKAICLYNTEHLPYPSGRVRQILAEFSGTVNIVVANEATYSVHALADLLPYAPESVVE